MWSKQSSDIIGEKAINCIYAVWYFSHKMFDYIILTGKNIIYIYIYILEQSLYK